MKRLILIAMIIGTTNLFFSCQKDTSLDSELIQTDLVTTTEKFPGTTYTGVSEPLTGVVNPGTWKYLPNGNVVVKGMIAEWYETADDPLLTGLSMWDENWRYNINNPELVFWGKVEVKR